MIGFVVQGHMGCWRDMAFSLSHMIKMTIINIIVI